MAETAIIVLDGVPCRVAKIFQYKALVTEDRGYISDPHFLAVLNKEGADGWKHKEEQAMGASKLAILLERELTVVDQLPDDGIQVSGPGTVEEVDVGQANS
jgi:hypothetical protein